MKTNLLVFLFAALTSCALAQDPWTARQLMEPADLAKVLANPKAPQPIVYSCGMQPIIKNSIEIGPTMSQKNLNTLKTNLEKLPKDANIVIYCGCCPFSRCPNVRPAIQLLKSMAFTNYKLLNLPTNIKVDWIDHNYPMSAE